MRPQHERLAALGLSAVIAVLGVAAAAYLIYAAGWSWA